MLPSYPHLLFISSTKKKSKNKKQNHLEYIVRGGEIESYYNYGNK